MGSVSPVWRPFREGDEGAINDAFALAFGVSRSLAEWAWRYPPEVDGRAIILAERDGEVVAHCGGIPLRVAISGRELRALRVVDTFSSPEGTAGSEQSRPLAPVVEAFIECFGSREGYSLFFGFFNPLDGGPSISRAGFDVAMEHPIRALVRRQPATSPLRRLLYRAEGARDWEPRLDDLWRRVRHDYPVAVVRDADYAVRRFAGRSGVRYHRFLVFPRFSDRAVAFAVFRTDGAICRWVDLLWDRNHPGALELLARLSARLSHQHSSVEEEIWLENDPNGQDLLGGLGFMEVDDQAPTGMVAHSVAPDVDPSAFIGRAYLTMADTDAA